MTGGSYAQYHPLGMAIEGTALFFGGMIIIRHYYIRAKEIKFLKETRYYVRGLKDPSYKQEAQNSINLSLGNEARKIRDLKKEWDDLVKDFEHMTPPTQTKKMIEISNVRDKIERKEDEFWSFHKLVSKFGIDVKETMKEYETVY
jgi:hypothetical protein